MPENRIVPTLYWIRAVSKTDWPILAIDCPCGLHSRSAFSSALPTDFEANETSYMQELVDRTIRQWNTDGRCKHRLPATVKWSALSWRMDVIGEFKPK